MTLDIVMADDPSPSAAMPDEHELTQLALPLPEQAQLDELEATALAGGACATGDRGYAKSSRPVYHAGDRPSL
ncbi:hypothetical protein ECZU08_46580 [Escherichia coli]|nr:hypothetical protein ECZU03_55950 [Escherichia coli]GHK49062.1 hypothetical protein ECZU08_46580 [Escherichia coli]